jgi:hypothetical protein
MDPRYMGSNPAKSDEFLRVIKMFLHRRSKAMSLAYAVRFYSMLKIP